MEITLKPTWKQHLAYQALNDNPEVEDVFLGGGAGGGKSWFICESRLDKAIRYPGYRSFIGRQELKRLMQSTYITWLKVCKYHGLKQGVDWKLNGQYNYIEMANGSRIDLLDLKYLPTDPLYERFGSLEYTDGAIEEAGEVHFLAYDVLHSRVGRHMNDEFGIKPTLLVTANPKKNWIYNIFYYPWKKGLLPKTIAFIQSLYQDNEYTAESYGKQLAKIKDKVTRQRLKDGTWEYENDDGVLIIYDNILDLFTNPIVESKEKYISYDVARFGKDKITAYCWEGLHCYRQYVFKKRGIEWQKTKLKEIARIESVPFSHIVADEDGVGGGLVDGVEGIKGFVANSSPIEVLDKINNDSKIDTSQKLEKPNYKNLKAQCAYELAKLANAHEIVITIDLITEPEGEDGEDDMPTPETLREFIIQELEQIKEKNPDDDEKKLQIVAKEEVKDAIGRSPDFSDPLIMRMLFELRKQEVDEEAEAADRALSRLRNTKNEAK